MGKANTCVVLSFLILSLLLTKIYGNRQVQALNYLKFRESSENDRSEFEVEELVLDEINQSQEDLKEKDRIKRLPGQPMMTSLQYGGYVTVDESAGRAFYYYFLVSDFAEQTKPLFLWLGGGPGCSSFGNGAMQGIGHFRANSDGKSLHFNLNSWTYYANVLFVESPAGVGFSYSNKSSDYETNGDKRTAADNYSFLVNWLERFPEYKGRELYIAGESYAGHYVPQLSQTILHHNQKANRTIMNLKGILIGNAMINDETDSQGQFDYLASHGIISVKTADMSKACYSSSSEVQQSECDAAFVEVEKDIEYINLENLYGPACQDPILTPVPVPRSKYMGADPCIEHYVHAYLNRKDVQEALHANVTNLEHEWSLCSDLVFFTWEDTVTSTLPILHQLLNNGLRVWIFSGDTDGRVPITSTENSIKKMNLTVETAWYPWFSFDKHAGYAEIYKEGLTLATVREGGHHVPNNQPQRAFNLFRHFIHATPLPGPPKKMPSFFES